MAQDGSSWIKIEKYDWKLSTPIEALGVPDQPLHSVYLNSRLESATESTQSSALLLSSARPASNTSTANEMLLIKQHIERDLSGSITLKPQDDEDMWHAYNLIQEVSPMRSNEWDKSWSGMRATIDDE